MGKTTSHRLTEDLLVFHNNQCVKPSLFTLFTQSPSQAVTEAKFYNLCSLKAHCIYEQASASILITRTSRCRFKMRWTSVLLAHAMCFKGGVTRCVHSFLFMCIIFQPWIFFCFFFFEYNSWVPLTCLKDQQSTATETHINLEGL